MRLAKTSSLIIILTLTILQTSSSQLVRQWISRVSSELKSGKSAATSMTIDDSGYVYVTGWSTRTGTGIDFATSRYDYYGQQLWIKYYGGSGTDKATKIAIDSAENIYVVGSTSGANGLDYATVKYDKNGTQLWAVTYNGTGNGEDQPVAIAVNDSLNVFVTGWSAGSGTNFDFATIKYDKDGNQKWLERYNGPANGDDKPCGMVLRSTSDVYVFGSLTDSSVDYFLIKYNAATGDTTWYQQYDGPANGIDIPSGIVLSSSTSSNHYIYVTGSSKDTANGYDITTIRYSSTGGEDWVSRYDGGNGGDDFGNGITYNSRPLVTGKSLQIGSFNDIVTLRYNTDGDLDWASTFNGNGNDDDVGLKISESSPYVLGTSTGIGTGTDIVLVKYKSNGDEEWNLTYNGPGNSDDIPASLIYKNNSVYIAGSSISSGTQTDFLVMKFSQDNKLYYRSFTQDSFAVKAGTLKKGLGTITSGNVRDTIFSRAFPKLKKGQPGAPGGLVLGNVRTDSATAYGWMRIDKGKTLVTYLPHTGTPRGFDIYAGANFVGEKKAGKLSAHNNHLLGELIALKLNIAASDAGITPPTFGEIKLNDTAANPYNGKTLRQMAMLVDNLLTYWKRYPTIDWNVFDTILTRTNRAFAGPLQIASKTTLTVTGNVHIDSVVLFNAPAKSSAENFLLADFRSAIPQNFELHQNFPNPFNPSTTIKLSLPKTSLITLKVYNIIGQEIAALLANEEMEQGTHEVFFDASSFSAGVYFYRVVANNGEYHDVRKMVFVK
jgi:hypothetical protein